ncbi:TetR family transcriptional regulator [Hyalangium sp.]|uniref:TetR family transcriptional regulator n=1 Tax=Hyalangium sp. TaxID=2028555 RepID=UPI002D56EE2B|nr:TetR family transcriptional regulator [Hyalangium sp.]HYH99235.1 TetR family transcriptional regulator [Hyalangium sp.]
MKRALSIPLLCLLLGAPVWAATGLEAVRTQAQATRTEVRTLRERQQALRGELNGLAERIETLKAQRQGKLTSSAELDQALKRSQELSGALTGLAQGVANAEGESERAHMALHAALSEELARVRAAWDSTQDRQERARLVSRMRELRTERDAVRAALPASQVPALGRADASDDPEDLLEQADALRDSEDKVKQRLKVLKARITEVREERDLERRMSDFLGEEAMFDEQDRRLRLRVNSSQDVEVDSTPVGRSPGFTGEVASDNGPPLTPINVNPPEAPRDQPGNPESPGPTPARASDHRPQVAPIRAQQLAAGDFDDLATLEGEAKKLESLARELDSRASSLERRVRELE